MIERARTIIQCEIKIKAQSLQEQKGSTWPERNDASTPEAMIEWWFVSRCKREKLTRQENRKEKKKRKKRYRTQIKLENSPMFLPSSPRSPLFTLRRRRGEWHLLHPLGLWSARGPGGIGSPGSSLLPLLKQVFLVIVDLFVGRNSLHSVKRVVNEHLRVDRIKQVFTNRL
jgi:hypothetical protein